MNGDTCKDFLRALELYHDRKFSKAARDAYWAELRDYPDENITAALQASYGKFPPGRVPSINDFKMLLNEIRENKQSREKGVEMANRNPISRSRASRYPMVSESFKILNGLFWQDGDSDKLTARQCVEMMLRMEEKYPSIGWRQGADQLAAWLDRKEKREADEVDKELRELESRASAQLNLEGGKK